MNKDNKYLICQKLNVAIFVFVAVLVNFTYELQIFNKIIIVDCLLKKLYVV